MDARRAENLTSTQRLALAAVFVALGVVLSPSAIPVGAARVFSMQHPIDVLAGVLLGPWYAVLMACGISVLRNALGTGTFLAFPGSMFGALLVGLVYHRLRRTDLAALAEPIGPPAAPVSCTATSASPTVKRLTRPEHHEQRKPDDGPRAHAAPGAFSRALPVRASKTKQATSAASSVSLVTSPTRSISSAASAPGGGTTRNRR